MAKGGTLANIGQALAGYGSALSGNPMYLQNSLLLRQAQQQQAEQEQAQRQARVGNAAALNFLRGQGMEGTPATKAFQVNGKTYGQNREASPMGADPLRALALMGNPSSPLQSMAAQQAISQLFPPAPTSQVVRPGETLGTLGRDGSFTPTYTAPVEPKETPLPADVQVALWAAGGDPAKARQMLLDAKRPKAPEAPTGYRWTGVPGESDLAPITGGPADKPDAAASAPTGYRFVPNPADPARPKLEPIQGGPADIGQKGLPQAYKEAKAGIKTLRGSIQNFKDAFLGAPERVDPETGKKIPAVRGLGTEMGGAGAGTLDNLHTQILLGTKAAEALGALDKGAIDVAERFVRNPTGLLSPFQLNSYTEAQIGGYLKYLDDKEKNLDEAYQAGTWRPPGASAPQIPAGVSPQEWAAMTPEERALFK